MGLLQDLNIVRGKNTLASDVFYKLFPSFLTVKYSTPSDYVSQYWNSYLKIRDKECGNNNQRKRGINGKIFEYIIATLLVRENIFPIFIEAKVAFVPNIKYDLMLYSTDCGPICLSAKTSFRERYKQADLEAISLKYVHRKSLSFLITLSDADATMVNEKQKLGDVIGLDQAICATTPDFDKLITKIKTYNLTAAPNINVITSSQVITKNMISLN